MSNAYEIVKKARSSNRIRSKEVIERLFEDIVYLKGDRCFGDSKTIIGGIGSFEERPVTFIGIQKGRGIEEGVETNFGMPIKVTGLSSNDPIPPIIVLESPKHLSP